MIGAKALAASFRDPSGFVFDRDGEIYRQINQGHQQDIELLISSGLQDELLAEGLVVGFEKVDLRLAATSSAAMVLKPKRVGRISYPHEWCFSQLKDAALATLEIMRRSLAKGLVLKDASAYNIQFIGPNPVMIDTLSFEPYIEGEPWVAYKQFCQHFLAPLALMSWVDIRLGSLLQTNLDGIPLDLASRLLPIKTKLSPGLLAHVHIHGKAQDITTQKATSKAKVSKTGLLALIDSLKGTINGLNWKPSGTEWADYYSDTNYSRDAFADKKSIVLSFLAMLPQSIVTCCDLGANNGEISRLAVKRGLSTVALDIDPAAVEKCYLDAKTEKLNLLLPLLQDLRNPTPNFGWAGRERDSILERTTSDVLFALALVHHLVIGNNLSFTMVANFFATLGEWLIVEFVPKEDSQIQRMLVARKDIFGQYSQEGFESSFASKFDILAAKKIEDSLRTVYLMRRKSA
jgi:ribosomal protein L11 methylase PrmA